MGNRRKPLAEKKPRPATAAKETAVLAYVHPGQVSSYFLQSRENMLMYDVATSRHIVGSLNEWSSANISAARNELVRQFLDERDADWLLFMDADMAFDHDSLERLLGVADVADRPIVGGLCFGADRGRLFPTIYQFVEVDGKVKTIRVDDYPDGELVPCAATGAAFLLIHRRVLQAMRERGFNAVFPWFQETELDGEPVGEDLTFCLRAQILGFPIHVDTGVRVGHHKSTVLDHDMFQAQKGARDVSS